MKRTRSGMEVLAHLGRTTALEDAFKDLYRAGIDGFVHTVRDRDVDEEYLALVDASRRLDGSEHAPESHDPRRVSRP